LLNLLNLVRI